MTVYIFGVFANGYSQYPSDSTSEIFKKQYSFSKAPTQVAIHRDGNLIYYSYIRKLDSVKYIGISVVLTAKLITKIGSLFSVYENVIEIMANKGYLIHYGDDGKLTTSTNQLFENSGEILVISEKLNNAFGSLGNSARELPHVDYSVVKDSVSQFSEKDNADTIIKASHTFSYTYIYKDRDFDTVQINSYKGVLSRINNENIDLRKKNQDLKDENAKILRQKKQFKNVIILIIAIIGCGIGIYFLNDNLNHTQNQLTEANKDIASKKSQLEVANRDIASKDSTISVRNSTISSQSNTIANLNDTVSKYKELLKEESSRRISAEDKYEIYKSTLSGFQPFIVKSTSFDFSTGKYKINYYGLSYGKYTFSFRVIFPDNNTKNFERSFWVYTGSDNVTVSLSNSFDSGKYYTIEIMYNNRVIGGSRH